MAGDRCALNLTGPGVSREAVGRGDWVLDPAPFDVWVGGDSTATLAGRFEVTA